ncbi:MAG: hypothetical protein AAAB13_20725 [Pseudomonas sp.]
MALADKIKPYVREIVNAHEAGDIQATQIIRYYEMHRDCPGDPAAPAFCEAAFDDWMKSRKAGS